MKTELTQFRLKELLSYDPKTGMFTWAIANGRRVHVGDRAGREVDGYCMIQLDGVDHYAHRLAWLYVYGVWPKTKLDHIHGNRLDNRIEELREATDGDNARNRRKLNRNTSGFIGVSKDHKGKKGQMWKASIGFEGKSIYLGVYKSPQEASVVYEAAAWWLFGEFKRQEVA